MKYTAEKIQRLTGANEKVAAKVAAAMNRLFVCDCKTLHLTSKDNKKIAELIDRVSRRIFEKNRAAYRILANRDSTAVE
ncbi:MAG: hypothetical protein IJG24_09855 [Selenomonadaceae bacterium]|nr:hypothetical protein [Selenomonadaceae bacterium]